MDLEFTDRVLDETWTEFEKALSDVPLPLWNESTFRWFFVRSAIKLYREVKCHIEWNHVDLLARLEERWFLIEFKFFVPNRRMKLDGSRGDWKGGPSQQNFREFHKCVQKLRMANEKHQVQFDERTLIMIFPHQVAWNGKKGRSFREWYLPFDDAGLKNSLRDRTLPTFEHQCDFDGEVKTTELHCVRFDIT